MRSRTSSCRTRDCACTTDSQRAHAHTPSRPPPAAADEPDRTRWYSQTPFADAWRWVIAKNPFWMTSEWVTRQAGAARQAACSVPQGCTSAGSRGAPPHAPAPPASAAVFVNGGLIVSLVLGTKLWEHKRAVRAEQQALSSTKARKAE